MMVIQVNNKVLNQMKSCWILILSEYLYLLKDKGLVAVKLFFFQFQYCETLKFLYPVLYVIINFYVLHYVRFSSQIGSVN